MRPQRPREPEMPDAKTPQEQIVLDFFRILSTGDLEAIRKTLHADATWRPMVENIPGAGVHGPRDVIVDEFLGDRGDAAHLGDLVDHVDGQAEGFRLICQRALDRLLDPPGAVGRELAAL